MSAALASCGAPANSNAANINTRLKFNMPHSDRTQTVVCARASFKRGAESRRISKALKGQR
jgi:hypothetical protein